MMKQKKSIPSSCFRAPDLILTENEKLKCKDKFDSYKALGSTMLSKNELRKVIRQMGREISEQDLLQMIYQADPNGHGFISQVAFEKIIATFKLQKEENVINPIGLAFDEILRSYQRDYPQKQHQNVPWSHIQQYLQKNFGLKVNLKNFKYFNNSKAQLNSEQFKYIFS